MLIGTIFTNLPFFVIFKGQFLGIYFSKNSKNLQAFYYSHREEVYTILSKSEGVPFQILFFLGDLTWNDPFLTIMLQSLCYSYKVCVTVTKSVLPLQSLYYRYDLFVSYFNSSSIHKYLCTLRERNCWSCAWSSNIVCT